MTTCPTCGSAIAHADMGRGTVPYCPHCGWNSDAAAVLLRRGVRTYLLAAVCFLAVILLMAWKRPAARSAAAGLAVAAVAYPLFEAALRWWRLRRISDPANFSREPVSGRSVDSASARLTNANADWDGYYRARNFARATIVALPVVLVLFAATPIDRFAWLGNLSETQTMIVLFAGIGTATVLISMPLLSWAGWRCPRCGHPFIRPRTFARIVVISAALWRLVFDSDCASCHLPCGDRSA